MLWARTPADSARGLLEPEKTPKGVKSPSEATIIKRLGHQFRATLAAVGACKLKDLKSVLNATYVVAHTQIPPIIVRYASREIISHSINRAALARFTKAEFPQCDPPPATNMANNEAVTRHIRRDRSNGPLWLQAVLEATESPNADSELARLGTESADQIIRTFSAFARWLRSVSSRTGRKFAVKAVLEMVGVLGRYLGPFLESINPIEQDAESITELYWQAMEGTGPATVNRTLKGDLSRAIGEFERYLSVERPANSGKRSKLPWYPSGLADVDANPVSFEDYGKLLKRIEDEWPADEPERRAIAWLLVVLGFKSGLRRMECLCLQVEDVLLEGRGELLVRPTPLRRLKSANAERRIPIGALLTPRELERLREWKKKRVSNSNVGPTDCLFGISDGGPVDENIFDEINRLMRRLTYRILALNISTNSERGSERGCSSLSCSPIRSRFLCSSRIWVRQQNFCLEQRM
jgi:integrase